MQYKSTCHRSLQQQSYPQPADAHLCKHCRSSPDDLSPIGYNHIRLERFLSDYQLDRCEHCLASGRCLRGDHRSSNHFLCLCAPCYSGEQC